MAEDLFSSVVGIQCVILLFLIGSLVGRYVRSVSEHSGKTCIPQTMLSFGERGTLQYINMSDVCLFECVHACTCVCFYSEFTCAVATVARSLNILLAS